MAALMMESPNPLNQEEKEAMHQTEEETQRFHEVCAACTCACELYHMHFYNYNALC